MNDKLPGLSGYLPVLASDYEQTIEMLKRENERIREKGNIDAQEAAHLKAENERLRGALIIANSQNNAALKCWEQKDMANAWRYTHDNSGVFGEALSNKESEKFECDICAVDPTLAHYRDKNCKQPSQNPSYGAAGNSSCKICGGLHFMTNGICPISAAGRSSKP